VKDKKTDDGGDYLAIAATATCRRCGSTTAAC
jgi:hypothetical protein